LKESPEGAMVDRLERMEQRYDDLSAQLGLLEVITDNPRST